MRILKTIAVRDPKDFRNIIINVNAHRDVIKIFPNGDGNISVDNVTSEVMTVELFRDNIERVYGPCRHFDNYIDPETGEEILRGVVIHDGMQKCFYQRYDELNRNILNDVLKCLEMTKRMESL